MPARGEERWPLGDRRMDGCEGDRLDAILSRAAQLKLYLSVEEQPQAILREGCSQAIAVQME